MLAHSSKRLQRLKKSVPKICHQSQFQFLLQSLDRDKEKENIGSNALHEIRQSKQFTKTTPINFIQFRNQPQQPVFFDNVKHLKNSNISEYCSQESNKSNKSADPYQKLEYKLKKLLTLLDEALGKIPSKYGKAFEKVSSLSAEMISLICKIDQQRVSEFEQHRNANAQNLVHSQVPMDQSYLQIINGLEVEKSKLSSLVSQHERANIKMFVKINEGESEEIQQCKKLLASLFKKYKQLEELILSQQNKTKILLQQNKDQEIKIREKSEENEDLRKRIRELQSIITEFKTIEYSVQNQPQESVRGKESGRIQSKPQQKQNMRYSHNRHHSHVLEQSNKAKEGQSRKQEPEAPDSPLGSSTATYIKHNKYNRPSQNNLAMQMESLLRAQKQKMKAEFEALGEKDRFHNEHLKLEIIKLTTQNTKLRKENQDLLKMVNRQNDEFQQCYKKVSTALAQKNQLIRELENTVKSLKLIDKDSKVQQKPIGNNSDQKSATKRRSDTGKGSGQESLYRIIRNQALNLEQQMRRK